MSEIKSIYASIIEFQSKMPVIVKSETNPFYKSKYADLANIQRQIQKPLSEAGLGYTQATVESGLETKLFNQKGEVISFVYPVSLTGKAQEIGSAITYAKRYSLVALLGLIIDGDDDDGNQAQSQTPTTADPRPPSEKQLAKIQIQLSEISKILELDKTEIENKYKSQLKINSFKELTVSQASQLIEQINGHTEKAKQMKDEPKETATKDDAAIFEDKINSTNP